MTDEQKELRKQAAKLLNDATDVVAKIESDGWEVPARYISGQCKHWAGIYGWKGNTQ